MRPKRSHGEGSLYHRSNNTWRAQVLIDGKRKGKTFKTQNEALEWIDQQKAIYDSFEKTDNWISVIREYVRLRNKLLSIFPEDELIFSNYCFRREHLKGEEYREIYEWIDPCDNKVRYVGQAQDSYARYYAHLNKPNSKEMKKWLDSLKENNMKPLLRIVMQVKREKANNEERRLIIQRKSEGHPLFNIRIDPVG